MEIIPDEIKTALKAKAVEELKEQRKVIQNIVDEIDDNSFDNTMNVMIAILALYGDEPALLVVLLSVAISMLAEQNNNKGTDNVA